MTKVTINSGVCGFVTSVQAASEDQMEVKLTVESACPSIAAMFKELGDTFDAYDICLKRPGENAFYEYASKKLPGHAGCPVISGIVKCIEVECRLALPRDVTITFDK